MRAPRFTPHLRILRHGLDRLVLSSDQASFVFHGRVFVRLGTQLDGITPLDEIIRRLAPRVPPGDAYAALAELWATYSRLNSGKDRRTCASPSTVFHQLTRA